jgi:histidinol phosphatase-like PHP family hydrolase
VPVIREGARRGCVFVISTDAHAVGELDRARFGIRQARRAGLDKRHIINTRETGDFLAWIDERRSR